MKPSGIPADLMPDQAASAAAILEARVACPIHYGAFHNPPVYVELPDVEGIFLEAAYEIAISFIDSKLARRRVTRVPS